MVGRRNVFREVPAVGTCTTCNRTSVPAVVTSTVAGQGVPQGFARGLVDILQPAPPPPPPVKHNIVLVYTVLYQVVGQFRPFIVYDIMFVSRAFCL